MLKIKDIKLDLFSDADLYRFIQKGMRAEVCYIK